VYLLLQVLAETEIRHVWRLEVDVSSAQRDRQIVYYSVKMTMFFGSANMRLSFCKVQTFCEREKWLCCYRKISNNFAHEKTDDTVTWL